jgi:hypothetical protein
MHFHVYINCKSRKKAAYGAIYPCGSRDEAHTSKFRGRTLKRMPGMCKKQDRKGDAKTSIR